MLVSHVSRSRIVLFVTILLVTGYSFSQDIQFLNFSTSQGLSSVQVYDIYQDKNGLMWFATDNGITSFNGSEFNQFHGHDGIPDNTVFKFLPQHDGNVWCITQSNKVFYFNPDSLDFKLYSYNKLLLPERHRVPHDLVLTKEGDLNMLFVNRRGKLTISSSGKVKSKPNVYPSKSDRDLGFAINDQSAILCYRDEVDTTRVRFISTGYTSRYNYIKKGEIEYIGTDFKIAVYRSGVLSHTISVPHGLITLGLLEDKVFAGTSNDGMLFLNGKGEVVDHQLKGYSVTDALIDHEGGLWVSTLSQGVFYSHSPNVKKLNQFDNYYFVSLTKDNNDGLYLSTYDGKLYSLDGSVSRTIDESGSHSYALCQYHPALGGVLSNSRNGQLDLLIGGEHKTTYAAIQHVTKFSEPEKDQQLITIKRHHIGILDKSGFHNIQTKETFNDVCFVEGKLLLATYDGLYFYNAADKTKKLYAHTSQGIKFKDIDVIGNTVYAATVDDGVLVFQGGRLKHHILDTDGLLCNYVNEVYLNGENEIWACTNKGLSRIRLLEDDKFDVVSFSTLDGLYDNRVNDVEIINNLIYIATSNGLFSISIDDFVGQQWKNDYFRLLDVKVNNEDQVDLSNLSYDENKIEVTVQAVSFKYREYLRYRYKLSGMSDDWVETTDPKITLQSLPPGRYELIVQVATPMGWSSQLLKKSIVISPPFYKTWTFLISLIVFLSTIIYLFFKYRILIYNRAVFVELLRYFRKRMRKKECVFTVRSQGRDVKINSTDVLFIKSLGNYIEIHTKQKKIVVRERISKILDQLPDKLEYARIHRSYIIRLDAVTEKGVDMIVIGDHEIKVGEKFKGELERIHL